MLQQILIRVLQNPKTTFGGLAHGCVWVTAGSYLLTTAGCNFSIVQWDLVLGALFAGPAIQGALSTDNGAKIPSPGGV